jgi:hypothetical protein
MVMAAGQLQFNASMYTCRLKFAGPCFPASPAPNRPVVRAIHDRSGRHLHGMDFVEKFHRAGMTGDAEARGLIPRSAKASETGSFFSTLGGSDCDFADAHRTDR